VITILLVGPSRTEAIDYAQRHPSVEILSAFGAEEALEKLARNRRIDAVLLLPGSEAAELARTLREEDPSAPPLFAPASLGDLPGANRLPDGDAESQLDALVRALEPRP
jgi:hypothetical protein